MLVFKDGSEVETIPGTDPPEPFTLCRYKEVSGFGYSRIKLFLVPVFEKSLMMIWDPFLSKRTQNSIPMMMTCQRPASYL